ncbi:hypothetical protein [Devosia sp.]|uniref:hypothetical protein n=1 Tax=Devosia sp. TaxID=1871048 RepID=UPI003A900F72
MSANSSTTEYVTFHHPFLLEGLETPHKPGRFEVRTDREALDLSWPAFRLTVTIMLTGGGRTEALEVKRDALDAALARDAQIAD